MSLSTQTRAQLSIRRLGGHIGALIEGVRLSGDLDEDIIQQILAALHAHKAIFFRGQHHLTPREHEAFGRRLGPVFDNPTLPDDVIAAAGGFYELDGAKPDGRSESWHTDSTFCLKPPAAGVLFGAVIPEYGGDTAFANCVRAYETLTPALRDLADQLWGLHTNKLDLSGIKPNVTAEEQAYFDKVTTAKTASTEHPLVRVHPKTGERALLLGRTCQRIVGHTAQQSQQLKTMFQDHIILNPHVTRWHWTQGDVAIWDNAATQHAAVNDWGDQPRVVRRWTVGGDVPVSVDGRRSVAVQVPGS